MEPRSSNGSPSQTAPPSRPPELSAWWRILSLPLFLFIVLPIAALLTHTTPSQLMLNLRRPQVLQAISLSLGTTLISTVLIVVLGTPVALVMSRSRSRLRRTFDTLIDLPTVLPPAVAGLALLIAFGRQGLLGGALSALGIHIAFTSVAVILAQTFVASPFYVKAAIIGFEKVEVELEQAASLDGANGWEIFREVTIPLSRSALLGGGVMSWARALGEFGATIIFAGNFPGRTQTMPLAIYIGFQIDLQAALTLSAILVGFSFLAMILVKGFLDRE
jgi:molybdate transport system permease protein